MKRIFLILIFVFTILTCSGCGQKERPNILFNADPITKDTVMHSSNTFAVGQKVYYLFYTPKKIECKFIRIQIFKAGDTVNRGGYSIYWTNDYRVMKQNMYYYYNNFTIHQKGRFVMQVFSIDNLSKPLAYNEFWIQ